MSASLIPEVILKFYDENTLSCNELIMVSIIAGCLLVRCTRPSILLTILFVHYSLTLSDFRKYNYAVFILMISVGIIFRKKSVKKDITQKVDKSKVKSQDMNGSVSQIGVSESTGSKTVPITPSKIELNTPVTTTPSATTPGESSSSVKADRYKNAREEAKLLHDQVQRDRLAARLAKPTPKTNTNRIISDDRE